MSIVRNTFWEAPHWFKLLIYKLGETSSQEGVGRRFGWDSNMCETSAWAITSRHFLESWKYLVHHSFIRDAR